MLQTKIKINFGIIDYNNVTLLLCFKNNITDTKNKRTVFS